MAQIDKVQLQSYYQNPGDIYSDTDSESVSELIADQHNESDARLTAAVANAVAPGAVDTTKLANRSVTRPKIGVGAVGSTELDPALLQNFGDIAVQAKFIKVDAQLADIAINIKLYGAAGDGETDDTAAIQAAQTAAGSGGMLTVPKGSYKVASLTITVPIRFEPGAMFIVSSGVLVFSNDVDAGEYQIVQTSDNFLSNRIAPTSVKFLRHHVKVEWLGVLKVSDIDLVKSIPDQTGNLLKAYRAAVGDFVATGSNFQNENPKSLLKLGTGFYRVDQEFDTGYRAGSVYYYMNGSGIVGDGFASSFLVRTDLTSTARVLSLRYYHAELTVARGFKVTAYDPEKSGSARYLSAAAAMIWCQGDSLVMENVWASGGQVPVIDSNGVYRNGVGIQFESCVDTFGNNVFVERCITNLAFSSAVVKLNNVTSFANIKQNIGIGNFTAEWPDTQSTGNNVYISNIDARSVIERLIHVMSQGDNKLFFTGGNASGISTDSGAAVGTDVVYLQPSAHLSGSISNLDVVGFGVSLLYGATNSVAGDQAGLLSFSDIKLKGVVNTNPIVRGVVYTELCADANIYVARLVIDGCRPVLTVCKYETTFEDIFLSGYQGVSDGSASRLLFVQRNGNLRINRVKRKSDDSTALTAYGFQSAGSYALINIKDLANATRSITGTGTKEMISAAAFA